MTNSCGCLMCFRPGVAGRWDSSRRDRSGAGTNFLTWRTGSIGLPAKTIGSFDGCATRFFMGVMGRSWVGFEAGALFLWCFIGLAGASSANRKVDLLSTTTVFAGRSTGGSTVSSVGPMIDEGLHFTIFLAGGSIFNGAVSSKHTTDFSLGICRLKVFVTEQ